jgi:hypothetical protein
MSILLLAIWVLAAVIAGLGIGAIIHKAERLHKDKALTALLSALARQQASD